MKKNQKIHFVLLDQNLISRTGRRSDLMADIMTALLRRREILSEKIEEIKAAMSRIPSDFFRYREMANQVEIMEGKLKEVILEIYRERKQIRLFDDH